MNEPLYTMDILRLAASSARFERIDGPDASVERRSPVCGSRVIIDVAMDGGNRIRSIGGEIRACAFGQASAAMLHDHAVGRTSEELEGVLNELRLFLAGEVETVADLPMIDSFVRARAHPGRHPAILLPFEAAAMAARQAGG